MTERAVKDLISPQLGKARQVRGSVVHAGGDDEGAAANRAAVVPEGQLSDVPEVMKKSPFGQIVNDGVRFGSAFTKCNNCSTSGSTSYCVRFSVALS